MRVVGRQMAVDVGGEANRNGDGDVERYRGVVRRDEGCCTTTREDEVERGQERDTCTALPSPRIPLDTFIPGAAIRFDSSRPAICQFLGPSRVSFLRLRCCCWTGRWDVECV